MWGCGRLKERRCERRIRVSGRIHHLWRRWCNSYLGLGSMGVIQERVNRWAGTFFDAEEKLEWSIGFVADGERYVLELTGRIGDL